MVLIQGVVRKHFDPKAVGVVFMNLSRLASQWEEIVNTGLLNLEKESMRRFDGLIATIERLMASAGQEAPRIREDLDSLESLRAEVLRREG